jgi:hypothetical protein
LPLTSGALPKRRQVALPGPVLFDLSGFGEGDDGRQLGVAELFPRGMAPLFWPFNNTP